MSNLTTRQQQQAIEDGVNSFLWDNQELVRRAIEDAVRAYLYDTRPELGNGE